MLASRPIASRPVPCSFSPALYYLSADLDTLDESPVHFFQGDRNPERIPLLRGKTRRDGLAVSHIVRWLGM